MWCLLEIVNGLVAGLWESFMQLGRKAEGAIAGAEVPASCLKSRFRFAVLMF